MMVYEFNFLDKGIRERPGEKVDDDPENEKEKNTIA